MKDGSAHADLLALARQVLTGTLPVGEAQRDAWLAVAFVLSPAEYEGAVEARTKGKPGFILSSAREPVSRATPTDFGRNCRCLSLNSLPALLGLIFRYPATHLTAGRATPTRGMQATTSARWPM